MIPLLLNGLQEAERGELASLTLNRKYLLAAIFLGVLVSLVTGIVENPPDFSVIGYKYYGYPLVWRVTKTLQPTEFRLTSLFINVLFWTAISILAILFLKVAAPKLRFEVDYGAALLFVIILALSGFLMDLTHELGHVAWGVSVGGRLTYLKVAFLEIYPRPALTPEFQLGLARIEGLKTDFAYGLMLLGGSLTTNIVSWILAILIPRINLGHKTRVGMRIMGILGLLDLPLYTILPHLGLRHWFLIGGRTPEPLLGARKIGVPDPIFYAAVALTTLGLALLYFKPFWEKCWMSIRSARPP